MHHICLQVFRCAPVLEKHEQVLAENKREKKKAKGMSYHLSADPVKLPVTLIVHLVHEISEQLPKVVVVWRLEKIQPPDIP